MWPWINHFVTNIYTHITNKRLVGCVMMGSYFSSEVTDPVIPVDEDILYVKVTDNRNHTLSKKINVYSENFVTLLSAELYRIFTDVVVDNVNIDENFLALIIKHCDGDRMKYELRSENEDIYAITKCIIRKIEQKSSGDIVLFEVECYDTDIHHVINNLKKKYYIRLTVL